MTDDFKKKLFDYITGNYNIESGTEEPIITNDGIIDNDIVSYLDNNLTDWVTTGKIQPKDSNFIIIYGYYLRTSGNYNGFILILSSNMEIISLITKYDTETYFRPFRALQIDEDNYFYGIDSKNELYNENIPDNDRFIMLNKFLLNGSLSGTYVVILRQSYYFESTIQSNISGWIAGDNTITKRIGFSNYYFFPQNTNNKISIVSLTINVGSSNSWNIISTNSMNYYFNNYNIYDNNNFTIILCGRTNISQSDFRYIEELYIPSDNPTITSLYSFNTPLLGAYISDAIKINLQNAYVGYIFDDMETTTLNIYKINYNTISLDLIYSIEKPLYIVGGNIKFNNSYGNLFFKYSYDVGGVEEYYDYIIGIIVTNEVFTYNGTETVTPILTNSLFFDLYVSNIYNLYIIYTILTDGRIEKFQLIYNSLNYNGLDHQALNSMIPKSSILYDGTDKIAFARNLYNKVINGGTTTSTVEVPNNYLNDINISKEELISETNSILNSETTLIEKNIYEQLYINFINTLNVIDNNGTTQVLNPTGASRINDSISQTMDYDDTKIVKFVINYSDDTSNVKNFCSRTYSLTENRCTYTCIIYVPLDKSISNIQIKSNDGNTTYLTINTSSLVGGKYYRLSQDLVVE